MLGEGGSFVIGLTGGIASGKSTAAKRLREVHHFPVIDCDILGHRAYAPGTECNARVVSEFGSDVRASDGSIDRKMLGSRVFGKPDRLAVLSRLVWSEIATLLRKELSALPGKVVFVEAAVLLEAGWDSMCNEVWSCAVEPEVAVARLASRNQLDEAGARARLAAQLSNAERCARATVVLSNNGTVEELERTVDAQVSALRLRIAKAKL